MASAASLGQSSGSGGFTWAPGQPMPTTAHSQATRKLEEVEGEEVDTGGLPFSERPDPGGSASGRGASVERASHKARPTTIRPASRTRGHLARLERPAAAGSLCDFDTGPTSCSGGGASVGTSRAVSGDRAGEAASSLGVGSTGPCSASKTGTFPPPAHRWRPASHAAWAAPGAPACLQDGRGLRGTGPWTRSDRIQWPRHRAEEWRLRESNPRTRLR